MDVKDADLMCEQARLVKVVLEAKLAEALGVRREWILGRILPGQREGAAKWFENKETLIEADLIQCPEASTIWTNKNKTLVILIHVDGMVLSGTEESLEFIKGFLQNQYKIAVEEGNNISFLKRQIEVDGDSTRIKVNSKYIEGLVKLFKGVRKRKTPGDMELDEAPLESEEEVKLFRSGVGTLRYIAGDRPDAQFLFKEFASKLQHPTEGVLQTLERLVGYLHATMDFHIKMEGKDPPTSFRERARGLATGPTYVEDNDIWRSGNRLRLEWKPPYKIINYMWMRFHWRHLGIFFL